MAILINTAPVTPSRCDWYRATLRYPNVHGGRTITCFSATRTGAIVDVLTEYQKMHQ